MTSTKSWYIPVRVVCVDNTECCFSIVNMYSDRCNLRMVYAPGVGGHCGGAMASFRVESWQSLRSLWDESQRPEVRASYEVQWQWRWLEMLRSVCPPILCSSPTVRPGTYNTYVAATKTTSAAFDILTSSDRVSNPRAGSILYHHPCTPHIRGETRSASGITPVLLVAAIREYTDRLSLQFSLGILLSPTCTSDITLR